MVEFSTRINVGKVKAQAISEFLLHCSDEAYREWWPGTHLAFRVKGNHRDSIGDRYYFDEYVGERRLRLDAIVVRHIPGELIVWQLMKLIRLPAWLEVRFLQEGADLVIIHTLRAGYSGLGAIVDPLIKLYLDDAFQKAMDLHARYEFGELAKRQA